MRLMFRRDGDASDVANGERLVRRMRSEASFLGSEPREDGFDDFHAIPREVFLDAMERGTLSI